MISTLLGLVLAVQKPDQGPYWTWPTTTIVERAVQEKSLATRLEMCLVGVYRARTEANVAIHAQALSAAGSTYSILGDQRRAFACYEAALALKPPSERQAMIMNNLAIACNESGRFAEAEKYARGALAFWKSKTPATPQVLQRTARVLNQLGNALQYQGKFDQALSNLLECLALRYLADGREQQAGTQYNIGKVLVLLGRKKEALDYYSSALEMQRAEAKDIEAKGKSATLSHQANTMAAIAEATASETPELAVVLLKESVSLIQAERRRYATLPEDLRATFIEANRDPYRQLANLLLKLGRVGEAIRVLDLLKEQEASDYFRSDTDRLANVDKAPEETALWELWQKIPARAGELFSEFAKLRGKVDKTSEDLARLEQLRPQVKEAGTAVKAIYASIEARLKEAQGDAFRPQPIPELQADLEALNKIPGALPTAGLRVFAIDDSIITILVFADGPLIFRKPVRMAEWNETVGNLVLGLRTPSQDPRELSKKVYDAAFKQAVSELERRKIKQIVCSLDGPMRYVPASALWNGSEYLVEKFEVSYYAPGTRLQQGHSATWRVAGFATGTSKHGPLPQAISEVDSLVEDERIPNDRGLYKGEQFVDGQFTALNLFDSLDSPSKTVLHLATHFILSSSVDSSCLIAGADAQITLKDLEERAAGAGLFQHLELLYLSACSTAEMTPSGKLKGDGSEVDSFAIFALANSARTVMATLWQLNDASGSFLAEAFYRLQKANPTESLGRIVNLAQLETMGRAGPTTPMAVPKENRSGTTSPIPTITGCVPFTPDPKRPYAHPYYWAPLVLYGSFR